MLTNFLFAYLLIHLATGAGAIAR